LTRLEARTAAEALADRLRTLRHDGLGGRRVTQIQLAEALDVQPSSISSWESGRPGSAPPPHRLEAWARFFATERSLRDAPRLLTDAELSEDERERLSELEDELLELRHTAVAGEPQRLRVWAFDDDAPITIVCPEIPEGHRGSFASPSNKNYMRAQRLGDLDALLDLYAHLKLENPGSTLRVKAAPEVQREDLNDHVVSLGGVAFNAVTRSLLRQLADFPVVQHQTGGEVDYFEVAGRRRLEPTFADDELVEDVGLFARRPNPVNPNRSLSVCAGILTRGVWGAVLCFSDVVLGPKNEAYVSERFAETPSWGMLIPVPVWAGEAQAPSLHEQAPFYAWPTQREVSADSREPAAAAQV
jgi:transcriptional regulator with XRE-family HTH domain